MRYLADGPVPGVVQDAAAGEVPMVASADAEALASAVEPEPGGA